MVLSYHLVPGSMAIAIATPISLGKHHGSLNLTSQANHETWYPEVSREFTVLQSHIFFASSVQNWITTRKFNLVTWMIHDCQLCTLNILDSQVFFIQSIPQDPCMVYFTSFKLIFMVFLNVGKYNIPYIECLENFVVVNPPCHKTVVFTDAPRHYHPHLNDAITSTAHNVRLGHDLGGLFQAQGGCDGYLISKGKMVGKPLGWGPLNNQPPIYNTIWLYVCLCFWYPS